jgi:hypothetical protein
MEGSHEEPPDNGSPGGRGSERSTPEKFGWRKELIAPLILAFATAVLAGAFSYLFNEWGKNAEKETQAEDTALVLERNLWSAQDALYRSFEDGRYRLYDLNVNFPLDDEKLLAEKLDERYRDVAAAAAAYNLEIARANETHKFVQADRSQIACAIKQVVKGRQAVIVKYDFPEEEQDKVSRDLGSVGHLCKRESNKYEAEVALAKQRREAKRRKAAKQRREAKHRKEAEQGKS